MNKISLLRGKYIYQNEKVFHGNFSPHKFLTISISLNRVYWKLLFTSIFNIIIVDDQTFLFSFYQNPFWKPGTFLKSPDICKTIPGEVEVN